MLQLFEAACAHLPICMHKYIYGIFGDAAIGKSLRPLGACWAVLSVDTPSVSQSSQSLLSRSNIINGPPISTQTSMYIRVCAAACWPTIFHNAASNFGHNRVLSLARRHYYARLLCNYLIYIYIYLIRPL